jgi:hypothetical protein
MTFTLNSRQFREAVKDCKLPESDDVYLLRWLVGIVAWSLCRFFRIGLTRYFFFLNLARDFDLAKSEKMLRNVSALIFLPIIFWVNTLFVL